MSRDYDTNTDPDDHTLENYLHTRLTQAGGYTPEYDGYLDQLREEDPEAFGRIRDEFGLEDPADTDPADADEADDDPAELPSEQWAAGEFQRGRILSGDYDDSEIPF